MKNSLALQRTLVWSVVGVMASLFGGSTAFATNPPAVAYDLDFTTDYDLLMNPNDKDAQHFAMWKTSTQMMALRSAPMIRLTNRSTSTLDIESLRIELGVSDYSFDSFAFLEQPDNGNAILTSHSDMTFGGDVQNFVKIDLPNGLSPGDSVAFQARIIGASLANYEEVLWQHANALYSPNRDDNAQITVTYRDDSSSSGSFTPSPARLFEYPQANATFDDIAATGTSGTATAMDGGHDMQSIGFVRYSQAAVPEPTTGLLALAAITGCCGFMRRWRSR